MNNKIDVLSWIGDCIRVFVSTFMLLWLPVWVAASVVVWRGAVHLMPTAPPTFDQAASATLIAIVAVLLVRFAWRSPTIRASPYRERHVRGSTFGVKIEVDDGR